MYKEIDALDLKESFQVSRYVQREIMDIGNGIMIWVDDHVPHNVFKNPTTTVVIDYIVKDNDFNRELVKKYHGYINDGIYTQEGYGYVSFNSNGTKLSGYYENIQHTIDFLKVNKERLEVSSINQSMFA